MATSTQSTTPSTFMPRLLKKLSAGLSLDPSAVRIAVEETANQKPHATAGDKALVLVLKNPSPVNVNAGAGRKGFPLNRDLIVKVRTRGGLDMAGEDETALNTHWTFQDAVLNLLLNLPHTAENYGGLDANDDSRMPFLTPVKYIGGGDEVKRVKDSGAAYESVLIFRINYSTRLDLS